MPRIVYDAIATEVSDGIANANTFCDLTTVIQRGTNAMSTVAMLIKEADPEAADPPELASIVPRPDNVRLFNANAPAQDIDGLVAASPFCLVVQKDNGFHAFMRFGQMKLRVRALAAFSRERYGMEDVLKENADLFETMTTMLGVKLTNMLRVYFPPLRTATNFKLSIYKKMKADMSPCNAIIHDTEPGYDIELDAQVTNMVTTAIREVLADYDEAGSAEAFIENAKVAFIEHMTASGLTPWKYNVNVTYPGDAQLPPRINPNTGNPYEAGEEGASDGDINERRPPRAPRDDEDDFNLDF